MAEATVVPEAAAIALPDGVDPAVAALIGCCVSTGVGAVLKTAAVPAGASVAVIGLGGVGLSCVMGAVLAGASRIVAIDRVAAKLDTARAVGATDGLVAGDDRAATIEALRDLTDGGPDFAFEAIGRVDTVELAIESLPLGGTAVLVGMTPFEARAVVRGLSAGRRQPPDPRLQLRLRGPGGRFPALRGAPPRRPPAGRAADRPADRARRPRGRVRPAAGRRRPPPGRRLRLTAGGQAAASAGRCQPPDDGAPTCGCRRDRRGGPQPAVGQARWSRARTRSARACLIVPAVTAASRSALTAATTAAVTLSYGTFLSDATVLERLAAAQVGAELRRGHPERGRGRSEPVLDDPEGRLHGDPGGWPACGRGDPADTSGEQRAAVTCRGVDPGLEPVRRRPAAARPRSTASSIVASAAVLAAGASADSSTPRAAAKALRKAAQYSADLGGTRRIRAGGGRGRTRPDPVAGGAVEAATDPMMVPPTSAVATRRPARPAVRSVGIVWILRASGGPTGHRMPTPSAWRVKNVCGACVIGRSSRFLDRGPTRMWPDGRPLPGSWSSRTSPAWASSSGSISSVTGTP